MSLQGANHSLRKDYRALLVPLAQDSQLPQLHLPAAVPNLRSELVVCGACRFRLVHPVGSTAARRPYCASTPEGSGAKAVNPGARRCSARVPARRFLVIGQRCSEMAGQRLLDGSFSATTGNATVSQGLPSRWRTAVSHSNRPRSTSTGYRWVSAGSGRQTGASLTRGDVLWTCPPSQATGWRGSPCSARTRRRSRQTWPCARYIRTAGGSVPVPSDSGFRSARGRDSGAGRPGWYQGHAKRQ